MASHHRRGGCCSFASIVVVLFLNMPACSSDGRFPEVAVCLDGGGACRVWYEEVQSFVSGQLRQRRRYCWLLVTAEVVIERRQLGD